MYGYRCEYCEGRVQPRQVEREAFKHKQEVVLSIPDGDVLEGKLKRNKMKLVQAWIEIHQDELMANWELASRGEAIFKIDPLK